MMPLIPRPDLRPGDIITGVDGDAIEDSQDIAHRVLATPPGSAITFEGVRNGRQRSWRITVELQE